MRVDARKGVPEPPAFASPGCFSSWTAKCACFSFRSGLRRECFEKRSTMSRLLDPCEPPYGPGVTEDLVSLMRPGVPPIALFRVLAHNPRVLSRFRGGERELLILRVSRLCGCEYEWSIHAAVFAGDAGLEDADLRAT